MIEDHCQREEKVRKVTKRDWFASPSALMADLAKDGSRSFISGAELARYLAALERDDTGDEGAS